MRFRPAAMVMPFRTKSTLTMNPPAIAITIGDPAGVGPELALRAAASPEVTAVCRPLLVGSARLLHRVGQLLQLRVPPLAASIEHYDDAAEPAIVDVDALESDAVTPGRVDAGTGRASYRYVTWAIDAALDGRIAALVTGPIHKEAWHAAGVAYPGHTELLAERTGSARFRMMLTAPEISCVLATVHIGLADVATQLTEQDVWEAIQLGHAAVSRLRGHDARVTVCGLNPHAGEGGLFGHGEEERVIAPAIQRALAAGIPVVGPLPPDTAFTPARRAETDVYVCMYHDQGLIPLKALAFDDGVNVTLGLPIVRTSVDHGTALDIAWQGTAKASSLIAAVRLAARLTQ